MSHRVLREAVDLALGVRGPSTMMDQKQLADFVRINSRLQISCASTLIPRYFPAPLKAWFSGPRFPWSNLDIVSKLLGTYEQELHPFLQKSRSTRYDCVADVGCAEGYYAVGLGRLYGRTRVFAYDISEESLEACRENAALNKISQALK